MNAAKDAFPGYDITDEATQWWLYMASMMKPEEQDKDKQDKPANRVAAPPHLNEKGECDKYGPCITFLT